MSSSYSLRVTYPSVVGLSARASEDAIMKTVLDFETAVEIARVIVPAGAGLIGKSVRIKSGPFASFTGYIANVRQDEDKLEVGVIIFGHRKVIELSPGELEILDFKM